jgi:hypothetical protein
MGAPINTPLEIPQDVPAADAADQAREVRPAEADADADSAPTSVEANEYDAVEQSLVVENDEEDDYR